MRREMSPASRFLYANGVVLPPGDTPPVSTFLESHPGAYTTTRTHAQTLLFWDRHVRRLSHSLRTLLRSDPNLLFGSGSPARAQTLTDSIDFEQMIRRRFDFSLARAMDARDVVAGEELAFTALVAGNCERLREIRRLDEETIDRVFDVFVHIGMYVPPIFEADGNWARLAVVCGRRDLAVAKYSDWVRQRKSLESMRPCSATELLLSDDGDRMLEGTVTNFYVVCLKDKGEANETSKLDDGCLSSYEVQTTPVNEGVLPGVIRQLVIETCLSLGTSVREVSPSWSKRESWRETFVTNSLRLVQHVEMIEAPSVWPSDKLKLWKDVSWEKKQFEGGPGMVTTAIQRELMKKADLEGYPLNVTSSGV